MPLLLTEADVRELLTMPELIAAMDGALTAFSARTVVQPVRTVIETTDSHTFFGVMPAYISSMPALGAKLVTVYHSNLARGLPSHLATIILLNPETGELEAILDGRYITETRTAAVSAVSATKLARPESRVLAILGSGVQARSHVEALSCARRFEEIRAWSPNRENLLAFVNSAGAHPMESAEAAVHGADIVVLVTSSPSPVVQREWVKDGAHVISVGACRPTQREMDPQLVAGARLFVDSRDAALKESGDVVLGIAEGRFTPDHIVAELGDPAAKRESEEEVTVFKSLGLAVEDLAAAQLVLQRAKSQGRGIRI
ncbi:MAG: ornithine cyclodeaminase family protein [Bryobacteraceae bacterium]|jgi:ornithine cyclodeaminase/alanine dehydrogenase-like protein (mu-crystallin family)